MIKLKFGANFTIFILFFGIALIDAFENQNWYGALLFLLLAVMFIWADSRNA